MERRNFLKTLAVSSGSAVLLGKLAMAQEYFPTPVNEELWKGINRAKDPENKVGLEILHVPVITAPSFTKTESDSKCSLRASPVSPPAG